VETQDWYKVPSFLAIPEKFQLATSPLIQPPPPDPPTPTLVITYTSASNIPLALPATIALGAGINSVRACRLLRIFGYPGVNQRVRDWLQLHLERIRTVELERERQEQEQQQKNVTLDKEVSPSSLEKGELGEHTEGPGLVVDKIRGWVLMDYADTPNDLLPLLVECNYH